MRPPEPIWNDCRRGLAFRSVESLRLNGRKRSLVPSVEALRMAEARRARPYAARSPKGLTGAARAVRIGNDVINDIVRAFRIERRIHTADP
jgi:hypothetical protein